MAEIRGVLAVLPPELTTLVTLYIAEPSMSQLFWWKRKDKIKVDQKIRWRVPAEPAVFVARRVYMWTWAEWMRSEIGHMRRFIFSVVLEWYKWYTRLLR